MTYDQPMIDNTELKSLLKLLLSVFTVKEVALYSRVHKSFIYNYGSEYIQKKIPSHANRMQYQDKFDKLRRYYELNNDAELSQREIVEKLSERFRIVDIARATGFTRYYVEQLLKRYDCCARKSRPVNRVVHFSHLFSKLKKVVKRQRNSNLDCSSVKLSGKKNIDLLLKIHEDNPFCQLWSIK